MTDTTSFLGRAVKSVIVLIMPPFVKGSLIAGIFLGAAALATLPLPDFLFIFTEDFLTAISISSQLINLIKITYPYNFASKIFGFLRLYGGLLNKGQEFR